MARGSREEAVAGTSGSMAQAKRKRRRWPLLLLLLLLLGGGAGGALYATGAFDSDDDQNVATASVSVSSAPANQSAPEAGDDDGTVEPPPDETSAPAPTDPPDQPAGDDGGTEPTPTLSVETTETTETTDDGSPPVEDPANTATAEAAPVTYQRVTHDSGRLSAELPVGWTYQTDLYRGEDDGRCPSVRALKGDQAVRATVCQGTDLTLVVSSPGSCDAMRDTIPDGEAVHGACNDGRDWYAMETGGGDLTTYAAAIVTKPLLADEIVQSVHASIVVEVPLGGSPLHCGVDQQTYTDYTLRVSNNTSQAIVVRFHGWSDTGCAPGYTHILLPNQSDNIPAANGSAWSVTELDGFVMDTLVMGDGDSEWSIV